MKFKTSFSLISVITAVLFLSLIAVESDAAITWDNLTYNAFAEAYVGNSSGYYDYGTSTKNGPPLRISAYARATNPENSPYSQMAQGYGVVDESSMFLKSCVFCKGNLGGDAYGYAYTEVTGTFIADDGFFNFGYDYGYTIAARGIDEAAYAENKAQAFLQVYDNTTGSFLFNDYLINNEITATGNEFNTYTDSGADMLSIPIASSIGHEIQVLFWADYMGKSQGYACAGNSRCDENASFSINYNMDVAPVVPEPVSSILFLSGGATLAVRRYLRKRAASK